MLVIFGIIFSYVNATLVNVTDMVMVGKGLACIHCKKEHPIADGFSFDAELNLLCSFCNEIIYAVTEEAMKEVKKASFTSSIIYKKEPISIKTDGSIGFCDACSDGRMSESVELPIAEEVFAGLA